jgi:hypothetical protein
MMKRANMRRFSSVRTNKSFPWPSCQKDAHASSKNKMAGKNNQTDLNNALRKCRVKISLKEIVSFFGEEADIPVSF